MKRIYGLTLFLLVFPLVASATTPAQDVLVTAEGTVYSAETQAADDGSSFIALDVRRGTFATQTVLPDSRGNAAFFAPALAFDHESQTLFVFWLRMPSAMSSELLVSAYHDGKWAAPVSIDNKSFCIRFNLRIAVRRNVAQPQSDGTMRDIRNLVIHTVWWEETAAGETARYALVPVDNGMLSTVEIHDLNDFMTPGDVVDLGPKFNRDLLKHPAIIDTGSSDSVDVVFGDVKTNSLNRLTLRPIADGRIHIPIGRGNGGRHLGAPTSFVADWSGHVSAVASDADGTLLLYNVGEKSVNFLLYTNSAWQEAKTIPLNDKLSADAAIAALGRMLNQQ